MIVTPFLCLLSFYLTIGSDPIGLKIGIVNNEVKSFSECLDPLLKMTTIDGFNCYVSKISCRFLANLNESVVEQEFYSSFDAAYEDVKRGKLIGLINFPKNFTSSMRPLNELEDLVEEYSPDGEIQIYLDQSDRQITFFLKQRLFETFESFVETLMQDCGKARKVGRIPIQIDTIHGSLKDELRRSMTPGIIITLYFYLASILTSGALIGDRIDGIWNRVLLAGVDPVEILIAHIISNSAIMILQCMQFLIFTNIFDLEVRGSIWTVMLLIVLVGFAAIVYGLAVSIFANDFMTATFASSIIFHPMMIMCGEKDFFLNQKSILIKRIH